MIHVKSLACVKCPINDEFYYNYYSYNMPTPKWTLVGSNLRVMRGNQIVVSR